MKTISKRAKELGVFIAAAFSYGCSAEWNCDRLSPALLSACGGYLPLNPRIRNVFALPEVVVAGDPVTLYAIVEVPEYGSSIDDVFVAFPEEYERKTASLLPLGNEQYSASLETTTFSSRYVPFTVDAVDVHDRSALYPVTNYFELKDRDTGIDTGNEF